MTTMSAAATPPQNNAATGECLLRRNWGWFVVRGILALALGVVAFLFPANALFAFTLVFAAYAGADGILSLIAGIRGAARKQDRWPLMVLRGVLGIAAAALFVLMPLAMTIGYALATLALLGAWAILTGALEIAAAVKLRKEIEGEWLLALSGALSILLGLAVPVLLYLNPTLTLLSAAWVIATYAVIAGVALIGLGLRLRRSRSEGGKTAPRTVEAAA